LYSKIFNGDKIDSLSFRLPPSGYNSEESWWLGREEKRKRNVWKDVERNSQNQ